MKESVRDTIRMVVELDNPYDLLQIQRVVEAECRRRAQLRGIAAKTNWWTCPKCRKRSYGPDTHGYREMGDGTIRAQSWCKSCRAKH